MAILYFLLFFSVFIDTAKNIFYNIFGKNLLKSNGDSVFFNFICCIGSIVFFAAAIIASNDTFLVSRYTFISAIIFAATTTAAQYFGLLSISLGSMSFSVLFTYLSALIPTIFGCIYRSTMPTFIQTAGLLLMVVTFFLSIDTDKNSGMSIKWLLAVAGSFIGMGLLGVCQTVHQDSEYAFELNGFLFWTFVFAFFMFGILYLPYRRKLKKSGQSNNYSKKDWSMMLVTGIIIGAINLINAYLAGKMASYIFFPIVNGGVIILSGLASIFIFKEKLPRKKIAGLIIGIIATCLIGI